MGAGAKCLPKKQIPASIKLPAIQYLLKVLERSQMKKHDARNKIAQRLQQVQQ